MHEQTQSFYKSSSGHKGQCDGRKLQELKDHWQWIMMVPKGMWGKQEGFILRGSLWVLISKGQGEQVAEGRRKTVKWQLISQWLFHHHLEGSCSVFLLAHDCIITEHWLMNTEPWLLIWYLGPSRQQNLRTMMDYRRREGMRIFASVSFFPMSSSTETRRAVPVKKCRIHNSWRSHTWTFELSRGGQEKENFIIPITCTWS